MSEYDALLEAPQTAETSEYDALLSEPSEYDALLAPSTPTAPVAGMGDVRQAEQDIPLPPKPLTFKDVLNAELRKRDEPMFTLPKPGPENEAGAGLRRALETVEGFTSPANIDLLGGTAALGAVGVPARLIAGGFAAHMGKAMVDDVIPNVVTAVTEHGLTSPEAGAAIVDAGATGLMTAAVTGHALARPSGGGLLPGETAKKTERTTSETREVVEMAKDLRSKAEATAAEILNEEPAQPLAEGEPAYAGGPGAMGPVEAGEMTAGQRKLGGYNADVERAQEARGQTPTISEARKEDPVTWENAMGEIEKDPLAPEKLVAQIEKSPEKPITDEQQQMLTWRRADLENKMAQESERAVDPNLTPEEQAIHQSNAELLESELLRTEQANRVAGTASGRSLRSRQLEMNDDYTFAGLMRRERSRTGEVVPPETAAKIKAQADEIAALKVKEAELTARDAENKILAERNETLAATIKDLEKAAAADRPKYGQEVLDRAEKAVSKWEKNAEAAHQRLRKKLGFANAGIPDPTIVFDVAQIMLAKVGRLGLSFAEISRDLSTEFGEIISPYLDDAWKSMRSMMDKEFASKETRKVVEKGVSAPVKGEKTAADVATRAAVEAGNDAPLRGKTAYEAVRAALNEGVKGEEAIMARGVEILKDAYPELTVRQLDEAFTDYGKARHPSKEAIKVALRKQRQLRQMILKIQDLEKTGTAPRFGMSRDKPDADVRARIKELKAAVDKFSKDLPETPEMIASREATAIRAKENAIERLDRQLQGLEAEIARVPREQSVKVEQLQSQLNAMRELRQELKDAENPPPTEGEKYNKRRMAQIKTQMTAAEKRLAGGDFSPVKKKEMPAMSKETLDAKAALDAKKAEIRAGEEKWGREQRTRLKKALDAAGDAFQSVRGLVLGSDAGVLTRQGLFSWSRPGTAIRATREAWNAFWSPESMARWEVEMREREIDGEKVAPKRKAAGLQTTNVLDHPEELVVTRLISRIPDFQVGGKKVSLSTAGRALERFQTTFINDVRTRVFDQGVREGFTPEELKLRAQFINNATGRGNMKHVPKALSVLFTSPRYEVSRWAVLGEPLKNIGVLGRDLAGGKGLNRAAQANLRDIGVTLAGIYGLYRLAETAAGYSVNWNPTSTDFLKMRKGDEVWDVSAGLAPRLRDLMRLFVAFTNPSYSKNIGKVAFGAFMRSVNPALKIGADQAGVAVQRVRGVEKPVLPMSGFRSEEEKEGLMSIMPLIIQNTAEALHEGGAGAAATAAPREFIGTSVSRYPRSKGEWEGELSEQMKVKK